MLNLITLTACLGSTLSTKEIEHLFDYINAFYQVPYSITTRGLSRYTDNSLRTLFRFLSEDYNWIAIRVSLFKYFCLSVLGTYILVADETVEGKSRRKTFGIARFYSSTQQQTITGICFFGMSLVRVETGTSYFLGALQVIYSEEDVLRIAADKAKQNAGKERAKKGEKNKSGRKVGSKNKPKEENKTVSYRVFKDLFSNVMAQLALCVFNFQYLVVDSAYGTADYANLAREKGLFIISKFKCNTKLVLQYTGKQKGKKPKIYADDVKMDNLDASWLTKTIIEDKYEKKYYQFKAYAKNCFKTKLLNIVVIVSKRLSDGKIGTAILFSNDTSLSWDLIVKYYSLRFQIEFDFRDAKQHFGLSSFKNYKETNVTNFVNLSFTLCLVSKIHLAYYRKILDNPKLGILDLKILFKARQNVKNVLKLVLSSPETIFNEEFCSNFVPTDLINAA